MRKKLGTYKAQGGGTHKVTPVGVTGMMLLEGPTLTWVSFVETP